MTRIVEVPAESAAASELVIPFFDEWVASPHNDTEGEPFNHWNEEDPGRGADRLRQVPQHARLHRSSGSRW